MKIWGNSGGRTDNRKPSSPLKEKPQSAPVRRSNPPPQPGPAGNREPFEIDWEAYGGGKRKPGFELPRGRRKPAAKLAKSRILWSRPRPAEPRRRRNEPRRPNPPREAAEKRKKRVIGSATFCWPFCCWRAFIAPPFSPISPLSPNGGPFISKPP